ncbi:MAG: DNA adenine methylase [Candidatus Caenarcaniphilales bacterium]|nr:DNA adenine methylase [Candidatus Caenarcaniphilales bacterium]
MILDLSTKSKPIIKWAGGKAGLLVQFQQHFPTGCRRYIEPFLGGGAVFLALKDGTQSIINDSNPELFNLYKIVRDKPDALIEELDRLSGFYSEDFYYHLRESRPRTLIKRAARTIFLNKTGFNGLYRQNSRGDFNVPFGKRPNCPQLCDRANLLSVSERMKKSSLLNQDFEQVIDLAGEGDLVYCDPPYEPLNHTSSFNAYQGGGFSQAEQARLKDSCLRASDRGALVFISNSDTAYTRELYADFKVYPILAKRAINSRGDARGEISELLVQFGEPYLYKSAADMIIQKKLHTKLKRLKKKDLMACAS